MMPAQLYHDALSGTITSHCRAAWRVTIWSQSRAGDDAITCMRLRVMFRLVDVDLLSKVLLSLLT